MNRQRPIDVSEVTGNVRPVLPAGGSPLAGVVNPAGPMAPLLQVAPLARVRYSLHILRRPKSR